VSIRFVFCIHNHQPVGNFDEVIEGAYQQAYRPFLDVMERYPAVPWVLHNSGCLWEWLEARHPEYIERIREQVHAGRLELLGGGFYEPILPALAPADRRGQIVRMSDYLAQRFGEPPQGLWLTERVWEPDLPIDIHAAGLRYLPIDDTQLHQAGVDPERVREPFETESGGRIVRLFPALMELRYRIPFADPLETVRFLEAPFPGGGEGLAVYADDGEKFGVWPGTHRLVYAERWLERFLDALVEARDRVAVTTFAAQAKARGAGLVYLPNGSYAEMGQWALPPQMQAGHARAREQLRAGGLAREADLFVRGATWRGFFARYPESGWMHLRVAGASERLRELQARLAPPDLASARDHLWRAQCNCAYWHGVFGGLYLPHLRDGIYRELIAGEAALARAERGAGAWVGAREIDPDGDGRGELVLENDALSLVIDPDEGGRLVEWDDRAAGMNLINGLARRSELYHRELREPGSAEGEGHAETIHAAVRAREAGLADLLVYDREPRACLIDRFFERRPDAETLRRATAIEAGACSGAPYAHELLDAGTSLSLLMRHAGPLTIAGREHAVEIEKTLTLDAGARGFRVRWVWRNASASRRLEVWAACENLINLLAGDAADRWVMEDGAQTPAPRLRASEDLPGVRSLALVDAWRGWHVALEVTPAVGVIRYPVETVSLSETGAERNYQGSALVFVVPLALEPGARFVLEMTAEVRPGVPAPVARRGKKANERA
jgi:4-alpha-glucanotransferase